MGFWLRLTCQNFASTLLDTQDLNTMRGSSLAMLDAPRWIESHLRHRFPEAVERVYIGASEGVFHVEGASEDDLVAAVERLCRGTETLAPPGSEDAVFKTPPEGLLQQLSISAVTAPGELRYAAASRALLAATRVRQLKEPTWSPPVAADGRIDALPRGAQADPIASKRPFCPLDRTRRADTLDQGPEGARRLSRSVAVRRQYGRKARTEFYRSETGRMTVLPVADSFEAIVTAPPDDVPEQLQTKLALLYLDGNSFTKIRMQGEAELQVRGGGRLYEQVFSSQLSGLRKGLMTRLADQFEADPRLQGRNRDGQAALALETLLWGGDEMMWVFPAWAVWDVLSSVAQDIAGWRFTETGERLHHGGGLAICHYKTPIRTIDRLVRVLADQAKEQGRDRSLLHYEVLEGIDAPTDLQTYRRQRFGPASGTAFTFDLDGWDALGRLFERVKAKVPRSQIFRLLQEARRAHAEGAPSVQLAEQAKRLFAEYERGLERAVFEGDGLGMGPGRGVMPLIHLAQLWDYAPGSETAD